MTLAERCGRVMRESLAGLKLLRAAPNQAIERSRPVRISVMFEPRVSSLKRAGPATRFRGATPPNKARAPAPMIAALIWQSNAHFNLLTGVQHPMVV